MRRSLILLGALVACGSGDVEPEGDCGANGECAPGYECRPTDRRCYKIASSVGGALDGLRWELPCGTMVEPVVCLADPMKVTTATMKGTAGVTYAVKLRFRGVVETKAYTGGTTDGAYFQTGGTPGADAWNIYRLDISEPAAAHYVNRGTSGLAYSFPIDFEATVRVKSGATVTLTAQSLDNREIRNLDMAGMPILVPGVPPHPSAYDGQFVQMDVVSVEAEPAGS